MDFQVSLTPKAERDLEQIGSYIAQSDVDAARQFCAELIFVAKSLQSFPNRHGSFAKRRNIRRIPHGSYLIFYKINEEAHAVEILRFWHAARSQNRLRLREEIAQYATPENSTP